MSRAYLRLDPMFADRKRHYPDGPYRALIDVFCAAEFEPKRGVFRSMAVLRAVIGRSARHLPYLFSAKDLRLTPDQRIQVVGWEEWQEGNWQVAERMRRVRERRESVTDVTEATVTEVTPDTVTVPSERLAVSGKRRVVGTAVTPRPITEASKVKGWLRDHEIAQPVGWESSKVNELAKAFGSDAVIAKFEEARSLGVAITCRNYVRWAEQTLSPDQSPRLAKPNGSGDVDRERFERGVERTQREIARLRGDA